jgi:hypothetical protein
VFYSVLSLAQVKRRNETPRIMLLPIAFERLSGNGEPVPSR